MKYTDIHQLVVAANEIPPTVLMVRHDHALLSLSGHLFVRGKYVKTGIFNTHDTRELSFWKRSFILLRSWLAKKEHVEEDLVLLHDFFSNNYYHWLLELIPRFLYLRAQGVENRLILPGHLQQISFIEETLTTFGIKPFWLKTQTAYKFNSLLTVATTPSVGTPVPELYNLFRKQLSVTSTSASSGRRIYVSRSRAPKRKLVNEDQLKAVLHKHGFVTVFTEDLSFSEQVSLFSAADLVLGVHGAAFANIVFMPSGSRVIEIRNPDWNKQPCIYFQVSRVLNLKWDFIIGEVSETAANANNSDLIVDIDLVDQKINELTKSQNRN